MKCPKCSNKSTVIDYVKTPENEIYRKRKCKTCGHIFYTMECDCEKIEFVKLEYRGCKKINGK